MYETQIQNATIALTDGFITTKKEVKQCFDEKEERIQ